MHRGLQGRSKLDVYTRCITYNTYWSWGSTGISLGFVICSSKQMATVCGGGSPAMHLTLLTRRNKASAWHNVNKNLRWIPLYQVHKSEIHSHHSILSRDPIVVPYDQRPLQAQWLNLSFAISSIHRDLHGSFAAAITIVYMGEIINYIISMKLVEYRPSHS